MNHINTLAITVTLANASALQAAKPTQATTNQFYSMEFVTFNMLFSPYVEPSTYVRRKKTTKKVTKVEADVMCL